MAKTYKVNANITEVKEGTGGSPSRRGKKRKAKKAATKAATKKAGKRKTTKKKTAKKKSATKPARRGGPRVTRGNITKPDQIRRLVPPGKRYIIANHGDTITTFSEESVPLAGEGRDLARSGTGGKASRRGKKRKAAAKKTTRKAATKKAATKKAGKKKTTKKRKGWSKIAKQCHSRRMKALWAKKKAGGKKNRGKKS